MLLLLFHAISKVILQCHRCCGGAAAAIDMLCSKLSLLDFSSTPCDHIAKARTKRLSVISSAVLPVTTTTTTTNYSISERLRFIIKIVHKQKVLRKF
ncbi:hypothetical protein T05_13003 [Trichinella murrelli]|uniref:Secreted protein n=1 Tax=Trichinella murrelli TaxID=144512 RepID=A0A0V0TF86_9BILA|nr:hypothetical protein T05_13003 [Trichinella murrelli]